MNEKEMIEEMAKVMCGNDCEECAKETAQWRGCSLKKAKSEECLIKKEAKLLYEKGYRKIPEGSVVIPNKLTEETSAEDLIKIAKYNDAIRKRARKETAKEILLKYHVKFTPKEVDEIIKQYGVEVEE